MLSYKETCAPLLSYPTVVPPLLYLYCRNVQQNTLEYFFNEHDLDEIVSDFDSVQREVNLGISKLDFKVGDTYLEVKTPLTTINVKYGKDIKTLPPKPFSSTDRMVKHLKELAGSDLLRIMRRLSFCRFSSIVLQRRKNG